MKPVVSGFNDAFAADTIYMDHKVIVEFGSNRFNDGQVVTASSTKPVYRGLDSLRSDVAEFWRPSDVFNNKNYNTMKWLVCDAGAKLNDVEDGSGYRAISFDDGDYERGWWSENKSDESGVFSDPEWVQSEFFQDDGITPFERRMNKLSLYLTEGYANMAEVTVQYKDTNGDWIDVEANRVLDADEYEVTWTFVEDIVITGLRVYVHATQDANDWARINELNAYWIKDISEYVINIDVNEIREQYDGTVPVGTTAANTVSVELDNTESLFNHNEPDSIYAPYIGANNRVEIYYGVDVNQDPNNPNFQYVQMGEFWTDEWSNEANGLQATFTGRDFSKFLQDEQFAWGRVWTNTNIVTCFRDLLLLLGMPLSRINIDETNLRGYQMLFIKDQQIWDFMGQVAFADQGIFGFDYKGDFYYHSYNVLNDAPYTTPVLTLDWDTNIMDGSTKTEIFINKVKVSVSSINTEETGTRRIWGAESPTILSYAKLASDIDVDDTTITVSQAARQDNGNLTDNGWPERNGILFIPQFTQEVRAGRTFNIVTGGELIKYATRSDNQFQGCERGYLETTPHAWTAGAYIGEARYWDIEYDNSPALDVKYPFVTAIDSLLEIPGEEEPQAYVIIWERDMFNARLAIGNVVEYLTWLAGTGQTLKDIDNTEADAEINFATSIAGMVAVEKAGRQEIGEEVTPSAENRDAIRRYGKNEIEIDNPWIQTRNHAEDIANIYIDEYRKPRRIVQVTIVGQPALETGDRIRISNFPQLGIETTEYHIISANHRYDGSLVTDMTLREVKE